MIRTVLRAVAITAIGLAAVLGGAGAASADPSTPAGQPTAQELQAVRAAVGTPQVQQQLAGVHYPGAAARANAAQGQTASVGGQTLPVYQLGKDFVAGVAGAPIGDLAYVAVPARTGDGATATLWTARQAGSWQVVNIASGDREFSFAGALPAGSFLLHEPQIDAWYAVSGGVVRVLDVPGVATGTVYGLADYQRAVADRYADKQPGSAYARQGRAGGFDVLSGRDAPTSPGQPAGAPAWLPFLLLGGGLLVAGAATALLRPALRR
ncbi:hypothetical protein F0L68_19285 [Solihabitans fulvus]|uniref:Uncharacterized protein n=1 Tax=Solihabitans fulvus TaxID=1892852 RepID=A0A5B2XCN9_9PSEU|nr:hypothetical protein [Solihabitans fulvus]KAA2260944.1 hypothetical protein F0L68_19285 [Solihabitans fulvus]